MPVDQSFWLICAAFYLVDNLVFHASREIIIVEGWKGRWLPSFPVQRYRLGQRLVTLLPLFLPFFGAARAGWLCEEGRSEHRVRRTRRLLRVRSVRLLPYRVLSAAVFLTIFALGPIVTERAGLAYALVAVAPLHLAWVMVLAILLVLGRRTWGLTWQSVAGVIFECAVCPGYFANICRRLSLRHAALPVDPVALATVTAGADAGERAFQAATLLADDLMEHDEISEEDIEAATKWRAALLPQGGLSG